MTRSLIVLLLCLNAGVFVALVAGTGAEQATAQRPPRPPKPPKPPAPNYIAVTGKAGPTDAVYVVDLVAHRLTAWRVTKPGKTLQFTQADNHRLLKRDFGKDRTEAGESVAVGDYIVFTGAAPGGTDVLYVIDRGTKNMNAYSFTGGVGGKTIEIVEQIDLAKVFRQVGAGAGDDE